VKRLIIILSLLYCYFSSSAQDPQLTQFYSAPLYLAPSFAGATQQHRLASTYRNQWPGVPGAFVTYMFSYDHYFSNFNSGLGLLIMRDEAGSGDLSTTDIGIYYSYDIQIADLWHLRPGLAFKYTQRGINFSKLIWGDQISPSGLTPTIQVPSLQRKGSIDATVSLMVYSSRMWAGATVDHLFRPNYSLYDDDLSAWPMKVSVFGGYQVVRKSRLLKPIDESLSLAGLFKYQDHIMQFDVGVYWYKNPIVFGVWYRGLPFISNELRGDAICFLVGYKVEQFSIGYSYDFTINKLLTSTWGSHEIALIWEFTTYRKKKKRHMIPCPEF
jgi:type IX secretion system PorP/SprF family membrane protein